MTRFIHSTPQSFRNATQKWTNTRQNTQQFQQIQQDNQQNNQTLEGLAGYLQYFQKSGNIKKKLGDLGFKDIQVKSFCDALLANQVEPVEDILQRLKTLKPERVIMPLFCSWAAERKHSMLELTRISDLTRPVEWYPEARLIKRRVIMHVGPTNSGKTFHALKHLKDQDGFTAYCGPLRLLAHEVYSRLNEQGHPTSLVTGEEVLETPDATTVSCTVEMVDLSRDWDVAVVDEAQMIADGERGWAWTQALLGLKAKELHLCGEATAVPLVREILEQLGDTVEVREYQRLSPLEVSKESLHGKWHNVKAGDCVVTFSRKSIFATKRAIEAATGLKCATIYGKLPPETRVEQARLFNDTTSDYKVLVASDAVGMGLNLRIKRMIFEGFKKFSVVNGVEMLSVSQVKQIAGRAGRFGLHGKHQVGQVMAFKQDDVGFLRNTMRIFPPPLKQAGLMPTFEQVEAFARQWPNDDMSTLLGKFEMFAQTDRRFFVCNLNNQKGIANAIQGIPLTLQDRYQLITVPVNISSEEALRALQKYAMVQARVSGMVLDWTSESVLSETVKLPSRVPTTPFELMSLETTHRIIGMYRWLSHRFPEAFPEQLRATELKEHCDDLINQSLLQMSPRPRTETEEN